MASNINIALNLISSANGLGEFSLAVSTLLALGQAGQQAAQQLDAVMAASARSGVVDQAALDAATLQTQLVTLGGVAAAAALDALAFDSALGLIVDDASHLQYTTAQMDLALHGTADQIAQLNPAIIQWADNSMYTTAQVHQLVMALSEHGLDVSAILNGDGQAAIQMGEAMGADPVAAADLLASTLQIFADQGLTAKQATDLLTGAFYDGIPSVSGLQSAIDAAGGMANVMGVKFQDFVTTLDMLAQAGLSGAEAGTSLRYVLQTIADPTNKAATDMNALGLTVVNTTSPAFEKLRRELDASGKAGQQAVTQFDGTSVGLNHMFKEAQKLGLIPLNESFNTWATSSGAMSSAFYNAQGQFVGLGSAMDTLIQHVKEKAGGNKELMSQYLDDMFNVRSGRAASILTSIENFKEHYNRVASEIGHTSASKDATSILSTLEGAWKELKTTLTSAASAMGKDLLPPLISLVQWLNQFVGGLMKTHPHLLTFLGLFILIGAILSPIVLIITVIIGILLLLTTAMAPVIVVFLAVAAGIAVVAALIAALIVFWPKLGQIAGQVGAAIGSFFSWLGTQAHNAVAAVGGWFSWLGGELHKHWDEITTKITQVWDDIPKIFQQGLDKAEKWVSDALHTVVGWFEWLYNHNYYFQHLVDFIVFMFTDLKNRATAIWNAITSWLVSTWITITSEAKVHWDKLTSIIGGLFNALGTLLHTIATNIQTDLLKAWGIVKTDAANVWQAIVDGVHAKLDPLVKAVQDIGKSIGDTVGGWIQNAYTWGGNLIKMLGKGISDFLPVLKNDIANVGKAIASVLGFHSPPPEGPLADSDTYMPNMLRMFASGISSNHHLMTGAVSGLATATQTAFTQGMLGSSAAYATGGSAAAGQGGTSVANFYVDGKPMYQVVMDRLTGDMRMNNLGTQWR